MPRQAFVELDSGEQEYFSNPYEAFKFAKEAESKAKNSVVLVGVSENFDDLPDDELFFFMDQVTIYRGQRLRHLMRSLDNVTEWVKTQMEEQHAQEASEDS